MVRLSGPLFSFAAGGALATHLIFRAAGRGHTAYPYFKPAQPNTPWQQARRLLFSFLSAQWPALSSADRQTWFAAVPELATSPRRAFLAYNLRRWSQLDSPSKRYPAAQLTTPENFFPFMATGGKGFIDWSFFTGPAKPTWYARIWRDTSPGVTRGPATLGRFLPYPTAGPRVFHDAPLPPGTYYAKFSNFSADGVWGHQAPELHGTAT